MSQPRVLAARFLLRAPRTLTPRDPATITLTRDRHTLTRQAQSTPTTRAVARLLLLAPLWLPSAPKRQAQLRLRALVTPTTRTRQVRALGHIPTLPALLTPTLQVRAPGRTPTLRDPLTRTTPTLRAAPPLRV